MPRGSRASIVIIELDKLSSDRSSQDAIRLTTEVFCCTFRRPVVVIHIFQSGGVLTQELVVFDISADWRQVRLTFQNLKTLVVQAVGARAGRSPDQILISRRLEMEYRARLQQYP